MREEKIATHDKSKSILKKFSYYCGNKTITFYDVTPTLLADYEHHLRTHYNNSTNTIHKNLKFIRKLFNDAYREDLIEHNQIPFNKFKLKTKKLTGYT